MIDILSILLITIFVAVIAMMVVILCTFIEKLLIKDSVGMGVLVFFINCFLLSLLIYYTN